MNLGILKKTKSILSISILFMMSNYAFAENSEGYAVKLGALDKITAKFSDFEILVGESARFGSLTIKIFSCQKRPPEEIPEDFVLLEIIDEIISDKPTKVFLGWMLSSNPSLSPLEHSTYDVWVKDCKIKDSLE